MIDPSFHGDNSPSTTEFIFVLDGDDGTLLIFFAATVLDLYFSP